MRKATRHDWFPNLLGDGKTESKLCTVGGLEQPRQGRNLLYWLEEPNEPTKEGPLSYVLPEPQFALFSTASRGHPSVDSLFNPIVDC
jgi:hypothetical protein